MGMKLSLSHKEKNTDHGCLRTKYRRPYLTLRGQKQQNNGEETITRGLIFLLTKYHSSV